MNAVLAPWRGQVRDFVDLTKPRITLLVLVTAFVGMWLAAGGRPAPGLVLWTLLGTALAASSSGVLNNVIDRHVDARMSRTRERALPAGRVRPERALAWGLLLGVAAFLLLSATVNLTAAGLALGTIAFYVGIYTAWLKRTSPACTEIGSVAGAAPPLIGWAAVTGGLSLPAWVLFGILFLWQPPHFWTLALVRAEEYRRAGLPMLPVVRGERVTRRRMLLYTAALLPTSALPFFLGLTGPLYLLGSLLLSGIYLGLTWCWSRRPLSPPQARQLFGFSILYLFALCALILADCRCGLTGTDGAFHALFERLTLT